MRRLFVEIAALAAIAGCGGSARSAFSHQFADNRADHFAAVLARLPQAHAEVQPENVLGEPLIVVTTHGSPAEGDTPAASEREIAAFSVESGEERWRYPLDAQTRPEILGDVVLASDRQHLVAIDLRTGRERWRVELADLAYVGATRDGNTIFYSSTVGALGGARRVGIVVALDASSGNELWRHEIEGVFGQPAATGGMVMVPWERQNLAILDASTGVELARLRSTDDVIAWAFDDPTGVYYGHRNVYRMTDRSISGVRSESTHLALQLPTLPVMHEGDTPRDIDVFDDGFLPKPGTRSARGRIRLYFAPDQATEPSEVKVLGDRVYFVYFRYVFGYGVDGRLLFARILEEDVIGAQPTRHGLFVVGEQGRMRLLDKDSGLDRFSGTLEQPLASVALDVAGFAGAPPAEETSDVRASLNAVAVDPDNRLVPARAFAIQLLAALEEPEVTRDLLDLYAQQSMPGALRQIIGEALRTRRTGSEHLIAALQQRFDFIEQTQVPPLEVVVPSLLEMQARDAVPGLIQQLQDHETPSASLPMLIDAITALGDASIVPALRQFLVLYRSDSAFAQHPEALAAAAAGMFRHGGPEGRAILTALAEEPRTATSLREAVAGLYEAERREQEALARREAEAAEEALAQAAREAESALPARLTPRQVDQAMAEHIDALRECAAIEVARTPTLGQVRLVFILTNDGRAEEIRVAPNSAELTECMNERVGAIQFPRFRQRRMRGAYVLSLRAAEPAPAAVERGLPEDAPWWAWSERRASRARVNETSRAWWERRPAPVRAAGTTEQAPRATTVESTTASDPASSEATPWWTGAGADTDPTVEEAAPVEAAPVEPAPTEAPAPRGRGRQRASRPVGTPNAAPPGPSAPPQPAPPPQPAAPPEPEPPAWWAPAEGG